MRITPSSLARALDLACRDEDRWREYKCLTWLAMLERERGRYADMNARCAELEAVAARLGDEDTPFVKALRALAGLATEEASADDALASALTRLRAVDDKSYLAYALNGAAHLYRQAGRTRQARLCASEALTVASAMRRHSEIAIARALLAPAGEVALAQDIEAVSGRDDLSVSARAALLASQARPRVSNGDPTISRQVEFEQQEKVMPRIIVERNFETPFTQEELSSVEARMGPRRDLYNVRWICSYWSTDRLRMVCEYDAADVASVRNVQQGGQRHIRLGQGRRRALRAMRHKFCWYQRRICTVWE